jgi:hypothetical protein
MAELTIVDGTDFSEQVNFTKAAVVTVAGTRMMEPKILVIAETIEIAMWALEKITNVSRFDVSYDHGAWYSTKGLSDDPSIYIIHNSTKMPENWTTTWAAPEPWDAAMAMCIFAPFMNKAQLARLQDLLVEPWS